jgi:hypothetical protein
MRESLLRLYPIHANIYLSTTKQSTQTIRLLQFEQVPSRVYSLFSEADRSSSAGLRADLMSRIGLREQLISTFSNFYGR